MDTDIDVGDVIEHTVQKRAELIAILEEFNSLFVVRVPPLVEGVLRTLEKLDSNEESNFRELEIQLQGMFHAITGRVVSLPDMEVVTVDNGHDDSHDIEEGKDDENEKGKWVPVVTPKKTAGLRGNGFGSTSNAKSPPRVQPLPSRASAPVALKKRRSFSCEEPKLPSMGNLEQGEQEPKKKHKMKSFLKLRKDKKSSPTLSNSGEYTDILPLLKKLEENDEICFDYNPIDGGLPIVRYGTLEKLVERLTLPTFAQG